MASKKIEAKPESLTREEKIERALQVLVLTPGIRGHLQQTDPKALEQAERALGVYDRLGRLTKAQREVLQHARSVIRDLARGWSRRDLARSPELVCEELSDLLGEDYDFEEREARPKNPDVG
jgi:hypothetical protein